MSWGDYPTLQGSVCSGATLILALVMIVVVITIIIRIIIVIIITIIITILILGITPVGGEDLQTDC